MSNIESMMKGMMIMTLLVMEIGVVGSLTSDFGECGKFSSWLSSSASSSK